MPDPFETLRRLDVVAPALPPAEVRRRGDRLRRRRTALTAVGAAAAVAAVVAGGLLTVGGTTGSAPQPGPATQAPHVSRSTAPAPGKATVIPAGFPLDLGLPRPGGDVTETRSTTLTTPFVFDPCHGTAAVPAEERTDFAEVRQGMTGGETLVRQLAVYPDPAAAHRVFASFASALRQCPTHDFGNGSVDVSAEQQHQVGSGSDESMVVVSHGTQDGQRTTMASHFVLAREGTAVLVVLADGEFGATEASTAQVDDTQRAVSVAVIRAMCPFATTGCDPDPKVLSADGYGDLRLGMPAAQVTGNPDVASLAKDEGGACRSGTLVDGGTFVVSGRLGVAAIWLGADMTTPEGVSHYDTVAEVKAVYPQGHAGNGYWVVPLRDGVEYEFGMEADGTLGEALVTRTDQDCFG